MGLFKSANAPATGAVNRTKTGQSIRGKISGPIPIPNPADDEFPMRHPGTGIATPLTAGDMKEQQMHPPQAEPAAALPVSVARPEVSHAPAAGSGVAHSTSGSGSGSGSGSTSGSPPTTATTAHANSPQSQRRTNVSGNLRYSVATTSSGQTGASKDKPQRKKSTLRGALGKLFGRKKKTSSLDSQRASAYVAPSQHTSDPSALSRAKEAEPKRSASLPITEYDRALRSHSIGPQDITAIESARDSLQVDQSQLIRKRTANSTTSQIYSAPFRNREGEWTGLSPRPASTHARGSRLFTDEDPEEIGRAITSDAGHKRRSRSLSGINYPEVRTDVRRRSDEIRYWRQSYDPGFVTSPTSSNTPHQENGNNGFTSMDMPDSPISPIEQVPEQVPEQGPVHTPPQPFAFDNLTHMNALAGMKITQAAKIESRIESLEERMRRMEDVVSRLCNSVPGFRVHADQPAAANPVLQQLSRNDAPSSRYTGSAHSRESHTSFGETPTYVGSLHLPASAQRPNSNSTIRGVTSLPAIARRELGQATETVTADHYTALLALLETEKSSRQALEHQVKKLTRRINMISGPTGNGRMSLQMEPPPTAKSFGSVSAFDHDSSDDEGAAARNRRYLAEDSGVGTGAGDDDSYLEVFATPKEEQPHSYGAFGEELRDEDDDPQRRKAARTLSLSQMTLGKKSSETGAQS